MIFYDGGGYSYHFLSKEIIMPLHNAYFMEK